MFAIEFVFPGGEVVPGGTYRSKVVARRMKAHYERPSGTSQHGRTKVRIVPAKGGK